MTKRGRDVDNALNVRLRERRDHRNTKRKMTIRVSLAKWAETTTCHGMVDIHRSKSSVMRGVWIVLMAVFFVIAIW